MTNRFKATRGDDSSSSPKTGNKVSLKIKKQAGGSVGIPERQRLKQT